MSTPLPPQQGTPGPNATRQLLDELDVLMQQMLAVPINDLGEDAPPQPEQNASRPEPARPPAPEPAPAPRPLPELFGSRLITVHEPSALPPPHRPPEALPSEADLAKAHERSAAAEMPSFPHWTPAPPAAREPVPRPAPAEALPEAPPRRPLPNRPPPIPGWWVRSLLWSNHTFDQCTSWLGPPGRWLQGTAGRLLLGWLGIMLFLAAVAWALANGFDWTW
jgi:hypothetical protein